MSDQPEIIGPVTTLAAADSRDYITPEDVAEAMKLAAANPTAPCRAVARLHREVLQVLGRRTGWGVEDAPLCACVAFEGEP